MSELRLAHISDLHFDERNRLEDLEHVLEAFLADITDDDGHGTVDAILISGDVFERTSTRAERLAFAKFLAGASELAPVYGVRGNHDSPGDLALFNLFRSDFPIFFAEEPTTLDALARGGDLVRFIFQPWRDRSHFLRAGDLGVEGMLAWIAGEVVSARDLGRVPIVIAHVELEGFVSESGHVVQGRSMSISPTALGETGAAYYACGHIHLAQQWCEGRVAYAGAANRNNFGEPEPKGWTLVQIPVERYGVFGTPHRTFNELPARRINRLEVDLRGGINEEVLVMAEDQVRDQVRPGDLVRIRYPIFAKELEKIDAKRLERAALAAGAATVVLEAIVEHDLRIRSEEIRDARTTWEKLSAFWRSKDQVPDEGEAERLQRKLEGLEGPAS